MLKSSAKPNLSLWWNRCLQNCCPDLRVCCKKSTGFWSGAEMFSQSRNQMLLSSKLLSMPMRNDNKWRA